MAPSIDLSPAHPLYRLRGIQRSALALMAGWSLLLLSGCPNPSVAELTASYFNLVTGTFTYATEAGLTETHEYTKEEPEEDDPAAAETFVYNRIARRGGFLQDDATVTFEATEDRELLITSYYDCLTLCGTLSAPITMFELWPIEAGATTESTTLVTQTRNGEPDGERTETHRFAVGEEESVTTAAGTFDAAFTVVWSRTLEDTNDSATFVISPQNGFVVFEDFSGQRFELTDGPLPEDDTGS